MAAIVSLLLAAPAAAQAARFEIDPAVTLPKLGDGLQGLVGWRAAPRLMQMLNDMGEDSALYRRSVHLQDAPDYMYIGMDFQRAEAQGMKTWLTCVGTPSPLSPNPSATENAYDTGLPEYARYPPTDAVAWADYILNFINLMESSYGVVPDYVELWNEPERVEWFKGNADDYVEMYAAAVTRLKQVRPQLRVGGPGLAGWRSSMDGAGSFLLTLVSTCNMLDVPLDFVSWHNYAPSTEILYSGISAQIKALAGQLGMPPLETVISEWNIYPSAEGPSGIELDGPHAAANLAGLLSCIRDTGLDHNLFFLDLDEDNNPGITDLTGTGLGLLTQHGVKKPSARVLEMVLAAGSNTQVPVGPPPEEWNVRVQASLVGNRMRLIVSNDVVSGTWVFANRSRENGMEPGWLYPIWLAAGGPRATEATLMANGLTQAQAQAVLGFIPEVLAFSAYMTEARPVAISMNGTRSFTLLEARRFTETINAPAQFQPVLLPWFEAAEHSALVYSCEQGAAFLATEGYNYTVDDLLQITGDFFVWAAAEGINYGVAVRCNRIMQDALYDGRLSSESLLNNLPETVVQAETPDAAGLTVSGRDINFLLEPNASIVIDLDWAPLQQQ